MRSERRLGGALGALFALACAVATSAGRADEPKPQPPDPRLVARGLANYQRYCLACHGERGDGRGESASRMDPRPRDFTQGIYEWRSTPSGSLPVDGDLFRTIRRGLYGTQMPRWSALTDPQIDELVAYVEHFSPRFDSEPRGVPIAIPPPPEGGAAAVERGRQVYEAMGCASCHGPGGRGDGPSARWPGLVNDWGQPIQPTDLTTGHFERGSRPRDLYRLFMTGLDGTPMPSYFDSLAPDRAWDLAFYLESLSNR